MRTGLSVKHLVADSSNPPKTIRLQDIRDLWWVLLLIFLFLPACSSEPSDSFPQKSVLPGLTQLRAPGVELLSRMLDVESIDVRVTLTRDDGSGLTQVIEATRVGATDQWISEPVTVPEGTPFTLEVVWSAIGVDGVRVDYARQRRSFAGVTSNQAIDFATVPYTFDEFNNDGGNANNYEELVAGTPPTGPPEPLGLPQPVQASLA